MPQRLPLEAAAELVRPVDTLGIPLGPGQPSAFLHALGARERFDDLTVSGALLVDLYELFTRPGVHYAAGSSGRSSRRAAALSPLPAFSCCSGVLPGTSVTRARVDADQVP